MIDNRLSLFPLDAGSEWIGTIKLDAASEAALQVSVARVDPPMDDFIRGTQEKTPNLDATWLNGLLGLQRKCTLVQPVWETFNIGAFGGVIRHKQETSGKCLFLVDGAWSDFLEKRCVTEARIASYALETLLVRETLARDNEEAPGPIFATEFAPGLKVTCYLDEETSMSAQERSRTRRPELKLVFAKPQDALNVIKVGFFMQDALSLVCGMKFRPLPVKLRGSLDGETVTSEVHIGSQHWLLDRYWLDGLSELDAEGVERLVVRLLMDMPSLSDDVIVYLDQLKRGRYSEDMIFWAMPALERNLHRLYESSEETSYLEEARAFWEYVDAAESGAIQEFARKHLRVVNAKRPSSKVLLQRAIREFESEGVVFPEHAAAKIWRARTKLMHGSAIDMPSLELDQAADLTVTLGVLILLKKMGLTGKDYAAGIKVISASCTSPLAEET